MTQQFATNVLTSTSSLSGLMQTFYSRDFLDRVKLMTVYDVGANKKAMPANSGKTIYFNRFDRLTPATTPLTSGTTPATTTLSTTVVSATVAQYGDWAQVSDIFELTSIDAGLRESVSVFAQQGAETIDSLIEAVLKAGATAQLANAKSNITDIAATDTLDGAEIRKAVRTLKKNAAMKFSDGGYKAIVPVSAAYDLMGDSEWLDASRYTDTANIRNNEIGKYAGVTFSETNLESTTSSTVTVYHTYVFGANAYAIVDIAGGSNVEIIVKAPSASDTSNPLNMYSTVGWKVKAFVAKVLNANWIIKINSGATA
jgi:N4-gp56 family major capsid protein